MKRLVLIMLLGLPYALFAQKNAETLTRLSLKAFGTDSIRYDVGCNEMLAIHLNIRRAYIKNNWPKALALAGTPLLAPNKNGNGDQMKRKAPFVNFGIIGSLSLPRLFKSKPRVLAEIKHYSVTGELLETKLIPAKRTNLNFAMPQPATQDGYLIVSFKNLESKDITTTGAVTNTGPHPPKESNPNPGDGGNDPGPEPDSDEPIAWENYIDGVTIVGTGTFANNDFMANYEAALGPSSTWIAVGTGSGDGSGSGAGDGGYEPPSAEAKKEARDLKKIEANKCEARYVLYHIMDVPQMGALLVYTKDKAVSYMNELHMELANTVGYSKENAFKHALVSAMNYCALGEQHSKSISDLHETCDGVNMNPSQAERTMDLYNNNEGFKIAKTVGCSSDFHEIKAALNIAYHNGTLHDINGNKIF